MSGSAELILSQNGLDPDLKAAVHEVFELGGAGRYVQIRIVNTTGRMTVRAVGVQAQEGERGTATFTTTSGA